MRRLRRSTQLLGLVLVNLGFMQLLKTGIVCPFFYCYGCPWAAAACPIGLLQTHAALGPFPFYAIGTLGIFGLTLGRFWCGWGCPFGTVQDMVSWIRRRNDFISLPPFPWTGLIVLVGVLITAWIAAETLFCKVCPAGSLFAAIPHRIASSEFSFGTFFYVHLATLAVALILFFVIGRFWCRYLCPLGSLFGLFNRASFLKVRVAAGSCVNCEECLNVCPVNIQAPEDIERSSSCIRCGKCIDACPHGSIKISASYRR